MSRLTHIVGDTTDFPRTCLREVVEYLCWAAIVRIGKFVHAAAGIECDHAQRRARGIGATADAILATLPSSPQPHVLRINFLDDSNKIINPTPASKQTAPQHRQAG